MRPCLERLTLASAMVAAIALSLPAEAASARSRGNDAPGKERAERDRGGSANAELHFSAANRAAVRGYFEPQVRQGKCPPGLAKKGNGCLPPGQAKNWTVGKPLVSTVVIEPLPTELVVTLGPPPVGHEFVRVAGDILMIATGTQMVVDAIVDLGGVY